MRPAIGLRASGLGARLFLPLVAIVAITFAMYAVVTYRSSRGELLDSLRSNAERSSDLIRRATHDGMLLNRLDEVQETLSRLVESPGVAAIRVYDKQGTVALSARPDEVGQRVPISSETCESCHEADHRAEVGLLQQCGVAHLSRGHEVLRHLSLIPNEPACAVPGCHTSPDQASIIGVLDVEMSMAPVEATLRSAQIRIALTTVALIALIGWACWLFIDRLVRRPVAVLTEGTRRIAAGDLETRIHIDGHHEFADLARSFNSMSEDLLAVDREVESWSRTLEDRVAEKSAELQRAHRQVLHMEKMASLGKLSATVAHELNNPISGMLNYARLIERELERQPLPVSAREELLRYLGVIHRECLRCGRIVSNLLLFARGSGTEMAPVDLRTVVDQSLMLIDHHLHVIGVRLEKKLPGVDLTVIADPGELQQALVALLINAVESMTGLEGVNAHLTVEVFVEDDSVRIDIGDTGPGIPAPVLPHIFEPFYSTKEEEGGVGLGLSVVYGIVQRHRGRIDVDSVVGRGTTIHLWIPRGIGSGETPPAPGSGGDRLAAAGGTASEGATS